MGNEFLRECKSYDHVGLISCIGGRYDIRTEDKISKDRRGLCAALGDTARSALDRSAGTLLMRTATRWRSHSHIDHTPNLSELTHDLHHSMTRSLNEDRVWGLFAGVFQSPVIIC